MRQVLQTEYADMIGVRRQSINKAISTGHIKKGYNPKTKRINVRIANEEWGNAAKEKIKHSKKQTLNPSYDSELLELKQAIKNYRVVTNQILDALIKHFTGSRLNESDL